MVNQMNLNRKRLNQYEIGDLVRIMISKIDRSDIDCPILLCKIMKRIENNQYILGSKFKIINIYYSSEKLNYLKYNAFLNLTIYLLTRFL